MYRRPKSHHGYNKYKTNADYTDKYKCTNYPTDNYLPNITNLRQMNNGAHMGNDHPPSSKHHPPYAYTVEARPMDAKCKKRDPCCVQKFNGHQPSVIFPGCYPPEKKKECVDPCVPRCMKLGVCKTLLSRACDPCSTCCMGPDCYIVPRHQQYKRSPMVFPCTKTFMRVYK